MITQLELNGVPAFGPGPVVLSPLRKVTFIFGPNGSGKTSISRALSEPSAFSQCALTWMPPELPLPVRAFNRDYVEKTFGSEADLAGVFVLGEASKEGQIERGELETELQQLDTKLRGLLDTLGVDGVSGSGKRGDLWKLQADVREAIWTDKNAFPDALRSIFGGFNASKQHLMDKVLAIREEPRPATVGEDDLLARAQDLATADAGPVTALAALDSKRLLELADDEIWAEPIVGSSDVTLADLIGKLQHSDWVKAGIPHLEHADGLCPFCQQNAPADFASHLAAYFDESFMARIGDLTQIADATFSAIDEMHSGLDAAKLAADTFVDRAALDVADAQLRLRLSEMGERVRSKQAAPSSVITISDMRVELAAAQEQITTANAKVAAHNALIADAKASKSSLDADSWNYFVWSVLDAGLNRFATDCAPFVTAIDAIETKINEKKTTQSKIRERLAELAAAAISSQPTINAINAMLLGAGFTSFKLASSPNLTDGYRLVREGGESAAKTLSEGERTFITYLYFLHEIQGVDATGAAAPCVVVIDDPISSLDSAALFFVSTTVRHLAQEVLDEHSNIKELIVLTHNVYFHKEVTHGVHGWSGSSSTTVAYHVIRKMDSPPNRLEHSEVNPVRTTYDLLWEEVKALRSGTDVPVGAQNGMRRIIESYFGLTGTTTVNEVPETFAGPENKTERMICQSLISWLHDGSHSTSLFDSLDYAVAGASPAQYLAVFERIFRETGHGAHFNLMMGVTTSGQVALSA